MASRIFQRPKLSFRFSLDASTNHELSSTLNTELKSNRELESDNLKICSAHSLICRQTAISAAAWPRFVKGAGVGVGSLKGVATIVGIAVTEGIRTMLTTLGDTPVLSAPKQADAKAMVRTAVMATNVLNPCCLLLSKAIFLFYAAVLAASEAHLVSKIVIPRMPHPPPANISI